MKVDARHSYGKVNDFNRVLHFTNSQTKARDLLDIFVNYQIDTFMWIECLAVKNMFL